MGASAHADERSEVRLRDSPHAPWACDAGRLARGDTRVRRSVTNRSPRLSWTETYWVRTQNSLPSRSASTAHPLSGPSRRSCTSVAPRARIRSTSSSRVLSVGRMHMCMRFLVFLGSGTRAKMISRSSGPTSQHSSSSGPISASSSSRKSSSTCDHHLTWAYGSTESMQKFDVRDAMVTILADRAHPWPRVCSLPSCQDPDTAIPPCTARDAQVQRGSGTPELHSSGSSVHRICRNSVANTATPT